MNDTKVIPRHTPKRTTSQNSLFWVLIDYMVEHCRPKGIQFDKESWHDMMCIKFLGTREVTLPTGETYEKQITTSNLPMRAPKDNPDDPNCWENFYPQVEVYCAELGYYLPEIREVA